MKKAKINLKKMYDALTVNGVFSYETVKGEMLGHALFAHIAQLRRGKRMTPDAIVSETMDLAEQLMYRHFRRTKPATLSLRYSSKTAHRVINEISNQLRAVMGNVHQGAIHQAFLTCGFQVEKQRSGADFRITSPRKKTFSAEVKLTTRERRKQIYADGARADYVISGSAEPGTEKYVASHGGTLVAWKGGTPTTLSKMIHDMLIA